MTIRIKDMPISDRPYDKLEMYGEKTLSNSELLAIILRTGTKDETVMEIAQKLLSKVSCIKELNQLSLQELMKIKGIERSKAIQIKAVFEIARRILKPIDIKKTIIKNQKMLFQSLKNFSLKQLKK